MSEKHTCPYCGSEYIIRVGVATPKNEANKSCMECEDCGAVWDTRTDSLVQQLALRVAEECNVQEDFRAQLWLEELFAEAYAAGIVYGALAGERRES